MANFLHTPIGLTRLSMVILALLSAGHAEARRCRGFGSNIPLPAGTQDTPNIPNLWMGPNADAPYYDGPEGDPAHYSKQPWSR